MNLEPKGNKGFTLIEVIVGVALFAVVSMILVSVMSFSLKMNYINKDSLDADSYSKAFFEAIKSEDCRPQKPQSGALSQTASMVFNNIDEVTDYAKNKFSIKDFGSSVSNPKTNIEDAVLQVGTSGKIGFIVQIEWNDTDQVFQIETWTWNTDKGESTMVNRKTVIAPSE